MIASSPSASSPSRSPSRLWTGRAWEAWQPRQSVGSRHFRGDDKPLLGELQRPAKSLFSGTKVFFNLKWGGRIFWWNCQIWPNFSQDLGRVKRSRLLPSKRVLLRHGKSTLSTKLNLQQLLDVAKQVLQLHDIANKFSKVTSFSCLHWVPNQPDAVSLFNKVLKPGGKFLFVVSRAYYRNIWQIITIFVKYGMS